jgi:hypothetical protein
MQEEEEIQRGRRKGGGRKRSGTNDHVDSVPWTEGENAMFTTTETKRNSQNRSGGNRPRESRFRTMTAVENEQRNKRKRERKGAREKKARTHP